MRGPRESKQRLTSEVSEANVMGTSGPLIRPSATFSPTGEKDTTYQSLWSATQKPWQGNARQGNNREIAVRPEGRLMNNVPFLDDKPKQLGTIDIKAGREWIEQEEIE